MKNTTIILFVLLMVSTTVQAQLNAGDAEDSWERRVYEKWDDFNPFWYFLWKWNYKKTDRRTIYARTGVMNLWAVYADEYEMHSRSTDSIFEQETYKALDRTLNKNYIVLQQPRVLDLYDRVEDRVNWALDSDIPLELYGIIEDRLDEIKTNIEFIKDTYSMDAEKQPLIEEEIKKLENLLSFASNLDVLAYLKDELEVENITYEINDAINLNTEAIESLIIE